jgi:hypothetical protein
MARAKSKSSKPASDPIDAFMALPDAEKERIWQSLDREFDPGELRPLTGSEREQWSRVKRKMGRPRIGKGVKVVSVSMERDLLTAADAYAKSQGVSRAAVFARAVHAMPAGKLRDKVESPRARAG